MDIVRLTGQSDEAEIVEIRKDGTIVVTPRISTPGDAGGPVITNDGKLVGLIVGSNGDDRTFIAPACEFFEKSNFTILKSQ